MRGKVFFFDTEHLWIRITPAYAGKSHSLFHSTEVEQDHPRLCGEKPEKRGRKIINPGSPPPMRGKVGDAIGGTFKSGITPAYAGKSSRRFFARSMYQDHPRLCGEKLNITFLSMFRMGSPPPMRGKVLPAAAALTVSGITPAYAGKSIAFPSSPCFSGDHPRLCGEKLIIKIPDTDEAGSPPPMRGKVCSCHG